ncbi:hypothetical protein BDB01DRAFT_772670 [Pilobolus umbonatus]|nr:hypothetical protein BDB01DRAFT_772670 [Pilobolus umbonatus]
MVAPHYSQLHPRLPSQLILSDVRLSKKGDVDHQHNLEQLKSFYDLFSNKKLFWIEVAMMEKMNYKYVNQQRHFLRYRRTQELRRLLKRVKSIAVDKELERLYCSFWNTKTITKCTGRWNYIPTKESIQYSMHRLISMALVLDKIKVVAVEVYRAQSSLFKLEHFVSFAMANISICSRLYTLSNGWIHQLEQCYNMLYEWSESFPSGLKQKDQVKFRELNGLDCNRDTFKMACAHLEEDIMKSRASITHKVHMEAFIANKPVEKVKEIETNEMDDMDDDEDLGEPICL